MAGAQTAWGLDVGVSALKAIKLRRDGERVTVEAFEIIEHDKFLTEPDVDRDTMIRSTLQKFMAKYAVRRDRVFIGVPGSMAFARFVKLPPVETKKIPEIVRFEAIQQIPFPLEQVNWDYHTFQHPDSPDVEVGIFAMKKELVAQVLSNYTAVELPVQGVQISPLAVYNAAGFDDMTAGKGTVVIDMGAEHTDLVVLEQGRLWLRTINIGGNHFTDALAKSFKQSFSKAEKLKKEAATSKYQKNIYQAMRPIFSDLVAEIQRSIGHYNSSHRDSRLERIVCTGNPFKLPNLQKYLQQELKMEVLRLEAFSRANVEKAAAFSEDILALTAAYGLAVQGLGMAPINSNLLPTEIARKMMWKQKEPWFIGAAAVVALGAVGIGAQYWMAKSAWGSQAEVRDEINAGLTHADAQVRQWNEVPNTFDADQTRINEAMKLAGNRVFWPQLMLDIYSPLPQTQTNVPAQQRPFIVINKIASEYTPTLSLVPIKDVLAGATIATPAAAPVPNPGDPNAAAAQPGVTLAEGESDHGFIVTITGYANSPIPNNQLYRVVTNYKNALVERAKFGNTDKPYYISADADIAGQQVRAAGPGGMLMGGGGGTGTASYPVPWGSATHGPYWDIFMPEITGIRPMQPGGAGGPGGFGAGGFGGAGGPGGGGFEGPGGGGTQDLPPLDLMLKTPTGQAKPLAGAYQFRVALKVHVK